MDDVTKNMDLYQRMLDFNLKMQQVMGYVKTVPGGKLIGEETPAGGDEAFGVLVREMTLSPCTAPSLLVTSSVSPSAK